MSTVGPLLSEYRKRNRLSQLDLSLLAEVSSRHISFIETGRTRPSRAMLMRLADVLNLTHRDSNLLLNSGGYAAAYSSLEFDSAELAPVRQALQLMLENHNPYPAIVMDGSYNVLMANSAQQQFMGAVLGQARALPSANILEALFDERMFRKHIANWDEVAGHLLRRLKKQVLAYANPKHGALLEKILTLSPPPHWQQPGEEPGDGPMLTVDFIVGEVTLSMFSTLSQFGTTLDTGMEELLIESYFPADENSRAFFNRN
ncbi:MAG: helix-turn-helix transcriptional regulator [Gammaproteobacteria bacterium]